MKRNQNGFTHFGIVLLILLVAVIGFTGYKVVKDRQVQTQANQTSTAVTATSLNSTIKTTADLNSATDNLNAQPVDTDLNPDQLNSDVSALL